MSNTSPAPLRIAIVHHEFAMSGGGHRQALALARELQLRGHHVRCIAAHVDPKQCYPDLMAHLNWVDFRRQSGGATDETTQATAAADVKTMPQAEKCRRLAELVAKEPTDIVNLHDYHVLETAAFLPSTLPVVWMLNDIHHINRNRRARSPLRKALIRLFKWASSRMQLTYLRSCAITRLDRIVVLDRRNRDRVFEAFGLDSKIVRSGCDLPARPAERAAPSPDRPLKLITVGILNPNRRHEDLIRAVDLLRKEGKVVTAKIVGRSDFSKDYAATLRKLVADLNLTDSIEFIDFLSDTDLDRFYREADIFVFPHAPQTWGLSPFEAMARGTPVVVTTGCGASEVLENGVTAMITDPYRPEALAEAIRRLASDSDLWQRMRTDGLEFVHKNISWQRYAEQMDLIFREELSKS